MPKTEETPPPPEKKTKRKERWEAGRRHAMKANQIFRMEIRQKWNPAKTGRRENCRKTAGKQAGNASMWKFEGGEGMTVKGEWGKSGRAEN